MSSTSWSRFRLHFRQLRAMKIAARSYPSTPLSAYLRRSWIFGMSAGAGAHALFGAVGLCLVSLFFELLESEFGERHFAENRIAWLSAGVTFSACCFFSLVLNMVSTAIGLAAGAGWLPKPGLPMPGLPMGSAERAAAVGLIAWIPAALRVIAVTTLLSVVVRLLAGADFALFPKNAVLSVTCAMLLLLPAHLAAGFAEGAWSFLALFTESGACLRFKVLSVFLLGLAWYAAVHGAWLSLPLAFTFASVVGGTVLLAAPQVSRSVDRALHGLSSRCAHGKSSTSVVRARAGLAGINALKRDVWVDFTRRTLILTAVVGPVFILATEHGPSTLASDPLVGMGACLFSVLILELSPLLHARAPRFIATPPYLGRGAWERLPLAVSDIVAVLHSRTWLRTICWGVVFAVILGLRVLMDGDMRGPGVVAQHSLVLVAFHFIIWIQSRAGELTALSGHGFPFKPVFTMFLASVVAYVTVLLRDELDHLLGIDAGQVTWVFLAVTLLVVVMLLLVARWSGAVPYFLLVGFTPLALHLNALAPWSEAVSAAVAVGLVLLSIPVLRTAYRVGGALYLQSYRAAEAKFQAESRSMWGTGE